MSNGPTPIDLAYQFAFRVGHALLRSYWRVRPPREGSILVAVWHAGEILIVKNSYRPHYTLPGGYPLPGEAPADTGARELQEECGVWVRADQMRPVYRRVFQFEGRHDDVSIVEVDLPTRPHVRIDNREIVAARFAPPAEVLALDIVPHLRDYLTNDK